MRSPRTIELDLAKHSSPRSGIVWVSIALGIAAFAAIGFGWSQHVSAAGTVVADNVHYAGNPVEGMPAGDLAPLVADRALELLSQQITITFGENEVSIPLSRLGFRYDPLETGLNIVDARHSGQPWDQFAAWVAGPLLEQAVDEVWSFDPESAGLTLAGLEVLRPAPAVEPVLTSEGSTQIEVVPGQVGTIVDLDSVVNGLKGIDFLDPPDELEAALVEEPPAITDDAAQDLADDLNELTRAGVVVSIDGHTRLLTAKDLRDVMIVTVTDQGLKPAFSQVSMHNLLESKFPQPVGEFKAPVFDVVDGQVRVVAPGVPHQTCCSSDSANAVAQGILGGSKGPFELTPKRAGDPVTKAWASGSMIIEPVGEFTTQHPCCEPRVTNIHQIADLVRGVYILPGETFSLNEFVGPRTRENGFVSAGAIRQGHMVQEVGGGVSQFVTTTFNAAYFAGLDFDEYRSHTIYFSRYPYGREATIGIPYPDLILNNTTEYPILVWTYYSDTSITVSMYSTKHIQVEELEQRKSRAGACTHVETDRERTYPDGRVVVDTVVADYRPGEGLDCSGRPIPEPAV
ncbi:MAG TPA: VanW family protein [Acidimicrobiia bacterium]|nr:VanW family protein [Acidimicrobiia bacterium]HLF61207.1 VanW family protein [Acidimicrobiia bacterium]